MDYLFGNLRLTVDLRVYGVDELVLELEEGGDMRVRGEGLGRFRHLVIWYY